MFTSAIYLSSDIFHYIVKFGIHVEHFKAIACFDMELVSSDAFKIYT